MEQPLEPPEGLSSRDRILWAAASLLGDEAGAAMSVRAVAARAGVSTGSLRHHFPTQSELMGAVLPLVYDLVLPNESIHDVSIPARDRLIASLQRLIAPEGGGLTPRDAWIQTFDRYVRIKPTQAVRQEFLAIDKELRRRIEYSLTILQREGSLAEGDNARRARYLIAVVNGLSVAQAFPVEDTFLQTELEVLGTAVDSVFGRQ